MPNATAKQLVEQVLSDLPDDATVEDVQYGIYVAELVARRSASLDDAIQNGMDAGVASGKLVPHDKVVQRMARWLRK